MKDLDFTRETGLPGTAATRFRPCRTYGAPHPRNDVHDDTGMYFSGFYFAVDAPDRIGRISGYVSREDFNWLAQRLGTPPLPGGGEVAS